MSNTLVKAAAPVLALAMLTGCSGVTEVTKERVARSETAVTQAQQTIGNSENGAIELQQARNHLEQAQKAVKDNEDEAALRHASLAQLEAELAVSKSQSGAARKAADEVQASIRQLEQEAARDPSTAVQEARDQ